MSCEACRAAFNHLPAIERAACVHAASSECCGCERYKAAENSPGQITDDETLHLIISDPQHLLNGTELNPVLAMQIDRGGLSTVRDAAADNEFVITLNELQQRPGQVERYFHGMLSFRAATVRYDEGRRFVCIYDTALPGKPNHSDLMAPPYAGSNREKKRAEKARLKRLIDLIGPTFLSAARFRNGAFMQYARPPAPAIEAVNE